MYRFQKIVVEKAILICFMVLFGSTAFATTFQVANETQLDKVLEVVNHGDTIELLDDIVVTKRVQLKVPGHVSNQSKGLFIDGQGHTVSVPKPGYA
ncbi:MAG: hypothetical protein JXK05_08090 [Campylobacterales bacterium]|nr:hypothetical protein [Campylobacterales bacterium]